VTPEHVVFCTPYRSARELDYLDAVLTSGHVHGDGEFTRRATALLAGIIGHERILLTSTGSDALEICSILLGVGAGDEVIVPTYTFASAATAVALVGATPVFVDSDDRDGNIDPAAIAAAITERTRAISVMNYAGVGVDMGAIRAIADAHGLPVIEDDAHGLGARTDGIVLGTRGDLAIQSFHDTKNVHSGEGGALIVNRADLWERAQVVRQKGTDRSRFLRGEVDRYTLLDVGSGYSMSELSAAVLTAQLEEFDAIQRERHRVWTAYRTGLDAWADSQGVQLMSPGPQHEHPAHIFFLQVPDAADRPVMLAHLRERGILATFHYVPLHDSPGGMRFGRTSGDVARATSFAARLVRLPLWPALSDEQVDRVRDAVTDFRVAAR